MHGIILKESVVFMIWIVFRNSILLGGCMKKYKRSRGTCKFVKDCFKIMKKCVARKTTNNWRKMHGKPMYRKYK